MKTPLHERSRVVGSGSWVPAWGQSSKANLNKILILQKRALRLIYFANKREHAIPLFIRANILPVDMLYYKAISTLMHDIHCKNCTYKLDTNIDSIHSYNTRSAKAGNLYEKFSRLHQQSLSFSRIGSKI